MDNYLVSQIAGGVVFLAKAGGAWLQTRFSDAKRIRQMFLPTLAVSALSFLAMKANHIAMAYGVAFLRSAIRATPFGAKHKNLVAGFTMAVMTGFTACNYERPVDLLPWASIMAGTMADRSSQGRYQRVWITGALLGAMIPAAIEKQNWSMVAAEALAATFNLMAINKFDIKDAAGKNKKFFQNFKAYIHGIFNDSVTGADKKAQVSLDGMDGMDESQFVVMEYKRKMVARPNPFMEQAECVAA